MRNQIRNGPMKKAQKKAKGGNLNGIIGGALGAMLSGDIKGALPGLAGMAAQQKMDRKSGDDMDNPESRIALRTPVAVTPSAAKMKAGGKVRGDGACMKGHTKGKMR